MRSFPILKLVALIVALAACRSALAGDPETYRLRIPLVGELPGLHDHSREVLPSRPGVCWIYQDKTVPIRHAGCVYVVEQTEHDRLLIKKGGLNPIRGWVASHDLVSLKDAEAYFSAAIQADRNQPFPYLMRAVLRHHLGQLDLALADLDETLRLDPRCADALAGRATNYGLRGDRDKAFADINVAIELCPTDAALFLTRNWVRCRFDGKSLDQALADVDHAIELDPANRAAFVDRATLNFKMKRPKMAIKDFKEAISRFPDLDLLIMSAMIMFQENERAAAREILKARLDQSPDREVAYKCHLMLATFDATEMNRFGARSEVDKAIATDPAKEDAYLFRAGMQDSFGFTRKAIEDLNLAIRASPSNPGSYEARAVQHYMRRDYRSALADLETCVRLRPDDPEPHERLAMVLATCPDARLRRPQDAILHATRACELSEWKRPQSLNALAAAEAEIGHFRAATGHQEQAISHLPRKDDRVEDYRNHLARYRENKPAYRLGLLEEWGVRTTNRLAN